MDPEAASRIAVFHRERAVRRSQDRVCRAGTKDMGISCGLRLHLDLVNGRGLGKAKHVDKQNLWIQEASKAGRYVTKKVGTNVNAADLWATSFLGIDVDSLEGQESV